MYDVLTTIEATKVAEKKTEKFIDACINKYNDFRRKESVKWKECFRDYIEIVYNSNYLVKTLLYRHEGKPLYSFYECMDVEYNEENISIEDIKNIIEIGNKLIISGLAGMGKTMMLKYLLLKSIDNSKYIPMLLELRTINDMNIEQIDIEELLYQKLCGKKFNLEKRYFEYSLEMCEYFILFDGYDEVRGDRRMKVMEQIKEFSDKYPYNYYLMSSRPEEDFINWNGFKEIEVIPLSLAKAVSLIAKLDYDKQVKQKFVKELQDKLYEKYQSFASNPLLLTMMLMTYEVNGFVPDKRNDFYEMVFATLFNRHDAHKGYRREIRCKLGESEFKNLFSFICFRSFFKGEYDFSESKLLEYIRLGMEKYNLKERFDEREYFKDLENSVCLIMKDGLYYRFVHRSFQEYFAAVYTTALSDYEQQKLIKCTMKRKKIFSVYENYLEILGELQRKRFERNILYPILKELKTEYEENGSSEEWLFKKNFTRLRVKVIDEKIRLFLQSEDSLFFWVGNIIWKYYMQDKRRSIDDNKQYYNAICSYLEKYSEDKSYTIKIDELFEKGLGKYLMKYWEVPLSEFKFAIDMVERIEAEMNNQSDEEEDFIDCL